ncbi:DUF4062 domain-containing protein [bacterium]|nr:DUF4062 domain-containing protein [bacterium]
MPRQEIILTVFVASPNDVDEERTRLEEVIHELNLTWARELGIRLDLVRWETHAYPGFGEDPQAVINKQIPNDYDFFIGIMWYRFGTPTGRAESGTIEEFQRAKERFDQDPSSVQLMIYFKDAPAPLPPSKLDHLQLARVAEFRSTLGEEGGLHWPFMSADDFEKLVRLHLTRHIQAWLSKNVISKPMIVVESTKTTKKVDETIASDQEEGPGFLDLMEQVEDDFATLTEITQRIAGATVEIGEKMEVRTVETKEFSSGPDATNRNAAKRIVAKAAADMDQYVHRMDAEIPLFSQYLNSGMNALIKVSEMSIEFAIQGKNLEKVKENLTLVRRFGETLMTVERQIAEFQQIIRSIPRMTTTLNRSKHAVVNVLQKLINELQNGQSMAREAEASFSSLLEQD